MDVKKMRQLTQNMEHVNKGTTDEVVMSPEEAEQLRLQAQTAFNNGEIVKCVRLLTEAANAGDVRAMCNLAYLYGTGKEIPKNPQEYFRWIKKAADKGDIGAMWRLAQAYSEGLGVEQNPNLEFAWLKKLAAVGESKAMGWIGDKYRKGEGVVQDYKEAIKWYKKSIDIGKDVKSMRSLSFMYADGEGVEKNLDTAIQWMTKAAEAGDVNSMYTLGNMYEYKFHGYDLTYGQYFDTDDDTFSHYYNMAVKWWEKAAEAGHEGAKEALYNFTH